MEYVSRLYSDGQFEVRSDNYAGSKTFGPSDKLTPEVALSLKRAKRAREIADHFVKDKVWSRKVTHISECGNLEMFMIEARNKDVGGIEMDLLEHYPDARELNVMYVGKKENRAVMLWQVV